MFKVGDYVQVVSGNYTITTVGSWGVVEKPALYKSPYIKVKFSYIASPMFGTAATIFPIQETDLAPFTPPPHALGVSASIPVSILYPPAPNAIAPPPPTPYYSMPFPALPPLPSFKHNYDVDILKPSGHDCMTNLKSYEGLTDTFRYCTICDHKVRD